jgi:hypothetical protein
MIVAGTGALAMVLWKENGPMMNALRVPLLLLAVLGLLLVACGEEEEEPASVSDETPVGMSPEGARDAALEFAAGSRFADASVEDLDWETTDVTPEGLVGGRNLQYDAEGWRVLVSYPVVAQPTYGIGIQRLETGEDWKGRVTSEGEVEESGFIGADGSVTVEGVLSGFAEDAEFDDLLVTDDGQKYGIEGTTPEVEESIAAFIKGAIPVRVTGELVADATDVEGRQIQVESIESVVPMPTPTE